MGRTTGSEQRIRQIVTLRSVAAALPDGPERRRIGQVERELRREVGMSVPKSAAARVLGISTTALDGWVARGKLAEVHRPGSSRGEIDAWSLIVVAGEVERVRADGIERAAVAEAVRRLEAVGRLPRRLWPNEHPLVLRRDFLRSTPAERLAEGAELAYAGTWLAAQGARARRLRAVG